jgi:hypothetical protein
MTMHPKIPTLQGAAGHFSAHRGPMKAIVDLKGMNNLCLMAFMKGLPFDANTQHSTDLVTYVTSLSKGSNIFPGGSPTIP